MDPTTDQLEDQIRHQRAALNSNIDELEQKVKSATDWRQQYRKSPGLFLAAAAGGGLVLALMTRRSGKVWVSQAPSALPSNAARNPEIEKSMGVIKSALIGVAAEQVKTVLARFIPGFEREYETRKPDPSTTAPRRHTDHDAGSPPPG